MKAGFVQTQLAATNRWWRSPAWEGDDPDLRQATQAPFVYRSGALANLTVGGLYVLRGPRRVGKSTEIKWAISDLIKSGVNPRSVIHAAVDGWRAEDLRSLITSASHSFLTGVTGPRYWFLDEITSVNGDWPSVIKNLRDNDSDFARDTIVLTGSSAAGLHDSRKALAGRRGEAVRADRALLPMRFTDVVAAAGLALPAFEPVRSRDLRTAGVREAVGVLLPFASDLLGLWETYLRVGGFPRAVATWLRDGDVARSVVDSLWDVVYGDAITSARFAATQTQTLLAGLSRGLCSPVNVANLARDVATTPQTMGERLTDLADHFLIWPCHREQDGLAKPSAQRKWYFIDPLLARLAALRGAGNEPDLTQLSEQQVGITLLRNTGAEDAVSLADFDAVLHYRSSTDAEIDFVGARMGDVAVESKYGDGNWGREVQTIRASRFQGVLATRSGVDWRDDAWVMPAPILALLLGG